MPPYPGGTGDENFAVFQANKTVWEARHWQDHVFDPLNEAIKIEKFNRQAETIGHYSNELFDIHPCIVLAFAEEFPRESQESLRQLLPKDYRKTEARPGNWRYTVKSILEERIADRLPDLKQRAEQAFLVSKRQPTSDAAERAINNFLHTSHETMFPPKNATRKYRKEFYRYTWAQRTKLKEIIGATNVYKLNICMEYLSILFSNMRREPRFDKTKELMNQPFSMAIKSMMRINPEVRVNEVIRREATRFVLDKIFGELKIPELSEDEAIEDMPEEEQ